MDASGLLRKDRVDFREESPLGLQEVGAFGQTPEKSQGAGPVGDAKRKLEKALVEAVQLLYFGVGPSRRLLGSGQAAKKFEPRKRRLLRERARSQGVQASSLRKGMDSAAPLRVTVMAAAFAASFMADSGPCPSERAARK